MNRMDDLLHKNKKKKDGSSVLSLLSRLYLFIRYAFSHSIVSCILCACADAEEKFQCGFLFNKVKNSSVIGYIKAFLNKLSHLWENNSVNIFVKQKLYGSLARCSRDYGIFFASSGVYVMISFIVNRYVLQNSTVGNSSLTVSAVMFLLSFIFIFSKESLSTVICKNKLLNFIVFEILGAEENVVYERDVEFSSPSVPLMLGMSVGVMCIVFPPLKILALLFILLLFILIFFKTDIGVMAVLVCLPLHDRSFLFMFTAVTVISYICKVLENKRTFKFELSDIFALCSAVFLLLSSVIHRVSPYALFASVCCILLYFTVKNSVRSWKNIKHCMTVQVFAYCVVCAYCILHSALTQTVFAESVLPVHLSLTFPHYQTVAVYLISTLPYLLLSFDTAHRGRDKASIFALVATGGVMVFSTYSYSACVCFALCLAIFLLTYSVGSFSYSAVFAAPTVLILWFLKNLLPDLSYFNEDNGVGESATSVFAHTFGTVWVVLVLLACLVFFGYVCSYANEYYFRITHRKSISKTVSAPAYSVLSVIICAVSIPDVDAVAILFMLFLQMSFGMAVTSYARQQDAIESEWFIGGHA